MGTMERFRSMGKWLFGGFAVLLVAFFTIGDNTVIQGLKGTSSDPMKRPIGSINGEEISYVDYENRVKEAVENQRKQSQDPNAQIDENQVRQQVWDQMVEEMLMKQEAEKLGVKVTKEQIADVMLNNPPEFLRKNFTDTAGVFNRQLYLDLVTNPNNLVKYMGKDPAQIPAEEKQKAIDNFRKDLFLIEEYLTKQQLSQSLINTIAASSGYVSPGFAKLQYKGDISSADVKYIGVSARDIDPNSVKVTDAEIQAYYDKNKESYKQKDARKIKYVMIPIQANADDTARSVKRINKIMQDLAAAPTDLQKDSIFDQKMSEFGGNANDYKMAQDIDPQVYSFLSTLAPHQIVGPIQQFDGTYFFKLDDKRSGTNEVVKASHILVKFNNNKDSAKAEAEKFLKQAKGGEDFAILATKYSEDKGSGQQGGDLGFFGKGKMVKEFEAAAFAAKVGEIVGPVESQFGYHIIKVTDKKSEEIKYSEIRISTIISTATKNKLFSDAMSFAKQIEGGANFDTLAKKSKFRANETPFFEKNRPVLGSRYLNAVAFENEIGKVIEPLELNKVGIVVAKITDGRTAGLKPLEDVKAEIKQILTKIKQLDMAKAKAEELYNKVKNFANLQEAANSDSTLAKSLRTLAAFKNTPQVDGIGQDAAFSVNAYKLPTGKINLPVRCETGYYIMEINNRNIPDDNTVNNGYAEYYKQNRMQSSQNAFYMWFQDLKEKAQIEDFRSKYFREY